MTTAFASVVFSLLLASCAATNDERVTDDYTAVVQARMTMEKEAQARVRGMCPASHPYVYRPANNYDYCCSKINADATWGWQADGSAGDPADRNPHCNVGGADTAVSTQCSAAPCLDHPSVVPVVKTPAGTTADPHVKNVKGQAFDLFSMGTIRLLQVPRTHGDAQPKLTVDGRVDRLESFAGKGCNHLWFRNLRMSGTSLDESYEFGVNAMANSFFMRAGNVSTESPTEFMKLAPASTVMLNPAPKNAWYGKAKAMFKIIANVQLQAGSAKLSVELVHNHKPHKGFEHESHLNFDAKNVKSLVNDMNAIGGLLGVDDHTAATKNEECKAPRILAESDGSDDMLTGSFVSAS